MRKKGKGIKQVILLLVLLSVICLAAIYSAAFTTSLCNEFDEFTLQMKNYVDKENWEDAEKVCSQTLEQWEKRKKLAPVLFHKDDVHDVSDSLGQVSVAIKLKDRKIALLLIDQLEKVFETIREFHTPTWQSVF